MAFVFVQCAKRLDNSASAQHSLLGTQQSMDDSQLIALDALQQLHASVY